VVAVLHGQLGDLTRPGRVPHRGQQGPDPDLVARFGRLSSSPREAVLHRLDDLVEQQARLHVQLRREAHLGVHHPVGGEVECALRGHPGEGVGGLHHADRVDEGLQVALQRPRVGRRAEPGVQLDRIRYRQLVRALGGQLDHRRGADTAVDRSDNLGRCRVEPASSNLGSI